MLVYFRTDFSNLKIKILRVPGTRDILSILAPDVHFIMMIIYTVHPRQGIFSDLYFLQLSNLQPLELEECVVSHLKLLIKDHLPLLTLGKRTWQP